MSRKQEGQYMTPKRVVDIILDSLSYSGETILDKTVIEPSFGTGVFLLKVAERITEAGRKAGMSDFDISAVLNKNIWGIEKSEFLYDKAIFRLNNFLRTQSLPAVTWNNLVCGDTLSLYKEYEGKADYVVGNPPFVTACNMPADMRSVIREFSFSQGKPELYVIFYEMCIKMLNSSGKLGFITPNTFLRNTFQQEFRNYLIDEGIISAIYDFKDSKVFPEADTYTCICILDKSGSNQVLCREYNDFVIAKEYIYKKHIFVSRFLNEPWNLCPEDDMRFLEAVAVE